MVLASKIRAILVLMQKISEKYLKSAVLGATDGIITTFAVVAGVVGAGFSSKIIIVLGIASMVADGVSMAVGDYLGERSVAQMNSNLPAKAKNEDEYLIKSSLITFGAFIVAGTLPLLPYIAMAFGFFSLGDTQFISSIIATMAALFFVGSLRTYAIKGNWILNGLEMLLVGSIAAVTAYVLGAFVESLV